MEHPLSPRWYPPLILIACAGLAAPLSAARGQEGGASQPGQAPPAQPEPPSDPLELRPVREVRILRPVEGKPGEREPVPGATAQLVRHQLRVAEGDPFRREGVSQDIARLTRLGRFRSIQSEVQPLQDGSVLLTYIVEEQPLILDVQVIGNRELSDQDLLGAVGVLTGTAVDPFQIDRAARAIEDQYRSKGYYRARVEVDERELTESSIVVFRVIEGERVRVMNVRFEGNSAFTERELRSAVRTTSYVPIFESGPLDDDVLQQDATALVNFYRDRGFLDAQASYRKQPSPDGREAIVTFVVEEGRLYTLRNVEVLYVSREAFERYRTQVLQNPAANLQYLTVEQMREVGFKPLSREQVLGLMLMKPGDVYSDDKLRRSQDAIRTAYAKLGHVIEGPQGPVSVMLRPRPVRDEREPLVDLIVFIEEGRPYLTGEVIVTGNELTQQKVILHEMELRPGRPLDLELLERSARNLEQRNLFAPGSIRITPQPAEAGAEHRDVTVEVQETNTGSVSIGATVSSDANVVGRFAITQRNFDLFDVPDSWGEFITGRAFRGAGQTANFEILPGTEVQTYAFSLSDPTLLDTDYSGSFTAFFRNRQYRQYDEERYGGRASVGRRFGRIWSGSIDFRNEWIELSDIDEDAPVDVYDVEDLSRLSSVGLSLDRTTLDSRTRPSAGSHVGLGIEQAGALGGDFDFTRLRADYTTFATLYESFLGYKTILKLNTQIGYIPQDQDDVPVYERFYLGGQSFRGFAFRGVSPRGIRNDTGTRGDDPVGGTFMFFAGAEVNQPVYRDTLSIVGFVDTGTVTTDFGFDEYRVSVGVGGRLFIPALSPIPLAFDFGFPLLKESGDRERVFTFSIDLPFQ